MVTGFKNLKMELLMMANGDSIRHMAKVNFITLMEISLMDFGSMAKLMAMENILTSMAPNTKASGKTTSNTEKAKKYGPMAQNTTETMLTGRNKE